MSRIVTRISLSIAAIALVVTTSACTGSAPKPPAVPEMTSTEIEAQAQLDLERNRLNFLGGFPDLETPAVTRVRFIDGDEWATVMASCLTEAGFPTLVADDGLQTGPQPGQEGTWALAAYTCSAQYPVDPRQTRALNDDQLRYLFEYFTQVSIPCLEGFGFSDFVTPPSLQTFIDEYNTERSWSPYETAAKQASPEQWTEIEKACPQVPSTLFGE